MEQVHIYDISVFENSLTYIKSAMLLLNMYYQKKDKLNRIKASKAEISAAIGVSYGSIGNWIRKLCKAGAIKYKYSGETRLNPKFAFDGTAEEYRQAIQEWQNFRSDIKFDPKKYQETA